jgi:serine/threonine protein kinase
LKTNQKQQQYQNNKTEVALPGFLRLDFASQLRVETALGIGGSGTLSTGVLLDIDLVKKYNTSKVALKFIQGISKLIEEENQQLFNREVSIMWSLNFNPNIAMLLGYTENPPCIVIKLYDYDLDALIHVDQTRLSLMEKILIFRDVARGLAGMHELNICHRDIKSANVLIDNEMVNGKEKKKAVICDFGLAAADESIIAVETGMKETYVQGFSPRYAAPEIFSKAHAQAAKSNTIQVNTEKAGDVYAFGVIVWEVLVEKIPWEGLTLEEIEMEVRQGNRPSPLPQVHESNEIDLLTGLMKRCWSASPQERPSMVDVQSKLDIIAQDD